jgi:hypothetical protein
MFEMVEQTRMYVDLTLVLEPDFFDENTRSFFFGLP